MIYQINHFEPRLVIVEDTFTPSVEDIRGELTSVEVFLVSALTAAQRARWLGS